MPIRDCDEDFGHNLGMSWAMGAGVVELPDGTRLRGRGIHAGAPVVPLPQWSLLLLASPPRDVAWPYRWLRWNDFWLPSDRSGARASFAEAHLRAAAGERVEVARFGGRGRTGTAIACIAQLGGVSAEDAVEWTREAYDRRAVETPWPGLGEVPGGVSSDSVTQALCRAGQAV